MDQKGAAGSLLCPIRGGGLLPENKGEISEVIQSGLGYHFIQMDDRRGTVVRPYEKVKEGIRFFLQTKKRQDAYLEYVKELKSKAKIMVNEKVWTEEEREGKATRKNPKKKNRRMRLPKREKSETKSISFRFLFLVRWVLGM